MKRMALLLACFIISSSFATLAGQDATQYPLIRRLSPQDVVFKQIGDSIAQGYQAEKNSGEYPDLFFCTWIASGGEDLMAVAARLSLPYETLASLNGIGRARAFKTGETVIIPSVAGVFVPDVDRNDLDILLAARNADIGSPRQRLIVSLDGVDSSFTFYPGSRLYQTERSFFLNIGFRMPLPEGVMTSRYGYRVSPIDGHDRMHEGVDIAAPSGTDVLAARDGIVSALGDDPVLGLVVFVDHEGGLRTVYGHLSRIFVVLNETVRSGTILGAVGSTGLSTGPHLHFEIRLSGKARDPSSYIPGLKQ